MTNLDFFLSKKWQKLEGPCGKSSHLTGVNFQVVWNDNSGETKVGGGRFWANSRSSSNATISFNFSILNKQKYSGGSKIRRPWWNKQLDGKMFRSIIFCWQNYCLFNSNKDFGQHWTPVQYNTKCVILRTNWNMVSFVEIDILLFYDFFWLTNLWFKWTEYIYQVWTQAILRILCIRCECFLQFTIWLFAISLSNVQ